MPSDFWTDLVGCAEGAALSGVGNAEGPGVIVDNDTGIAYFSIGAMPTDVPFTLERMDLAVSDNAGCEFTAASGPPSWFPSDWVDPFSGSGGGP